MMSSYLFELFIYLFIMSIIKLNHDKLVCGIYMLGDAFYELKLKF